MKNSGINSDRAVFVIPLIFSLVFPVLFQRLGMAAGGMCSTLQRCSFPTTEQKWTTHS